MFSDAFQVQVHDEDRVAWCDHHPWFVAALFDGHGGSDAVDALAKHVAFIAAEHVTSTSSSESLMARAICDALSHELKDEKSGAAGVVWVGNVASGEYGCANLGDVLGLHVTPSTYSHITTSHRFQHNPEECARVREAGWNLAQAASFGKPCGVLRVWPGGLAMGRSFGDSDTPSISRRASVSSGTFNPTMDCFVFLTDGAYEPLSVHQIVKYARSKATARRIVERATRGDARDDASCIVVRSTSQGSWCGGGGSLLSLFRRSWSGTSISSSHFSASPPVSETSCGMEGGASLSDEDDAADATYADDYQGGYDDGATKVVMHGL